MHPGLLRPVRQGLRAQPRPEPAADGTEGRHLIHSRHYKNVIDDDGNHISAGEVRKAPWVAITPVVHAIRVLERIVPKGELLLSVAHHAFRSRHSSTGALKLDTLTWRIESFVNWVKPRGRSSRPFRRDHP
jgi:hypothetical protein